jgi:hypothetical protein
VSPDGKTHNQIDHILVDWRWYSNVLDVQLFRATDCDTDHYRIVANVRERLAVSKQRSQRFDMERVNLKKLNKVISNFVLRSQMGLQLCEIWMQRWKLIVLGND